jgi:hypothetical protein
LVTLVWMAPQSGRMLFEERRNERGQIRIVTKGGRGLTRGG